MWQNEKTDLMPCVSWQILHDAQLYTTKKQRASDTSSVGKRQKKSPNEAVR